MRAKGLSEPKQGQNLGGGEFNTFNDFPEI